MVKREVPPSASASASPPRTPPPKKKKTPKSPFRSPTTSPRSTVRVPVSRSPPKGRSPEAKHLLLDSAMDMAYKKLPWRELSEKLGIPESRLKDQFKPSRANLRKTVMDHFA